MRTVEVVVIHARRMVEEIEIRISRPTDYPEPISSHQIDVTPRKRIAKAKKRPMLLLAGPKAA